MVFCTLKILHVIREERKIHVSYLIFIVTILVKAPFWVKIEINVLFRGKNYDNFDINDI